MSRLTTALVDQLLNVLSTQTAKRSPYFDSARLAELVWNSIWMPSPLGGALATKWVMDGTLKQVLRSRRQAIDARQALAARILEGMSYATRPGAYQIWLPLKDRWTSEAFVQSVGERGVKVSGASEFRADERAVPNAIRLSLSAPRDLHELERGLRVVRQLFDTGPGPRTLL